MKSHLSVFACIFLAFSGSGHNILSVNTDDNLTSSTCYEDSFENDSWIEQASYSSEDCEVGSMTIRMTGDDYYFCGVDIATWKEFKGASSKGKYYHCCIKDKFDCW